MSALLMCRDVLTSGSQTMRTADRDPTHGTDLSIPIKDLVPPEHTSLSIHEDALLISTAELCTLIHKAEAYAEHSKVKTRRSNVSPNFSYAPSSDEESSVV